ncbi:MAG: hypothetical protein JXA45_02710 [Methanomassiliicoccales archaeon]|nr:hypothetical protein [Methanomassiliicoccales archaeon]
MDMVLISGFLGSGKTTLILSIIDRISAATGKKIAVIVNDFGNIGIDGKVMEKFGLKVKELPQGCICCTLGAVFLDTVRIIEDKFYPDLIVVEPSGIANPDAILATMEHYRGRPLGFVRVVILVDTVRFPILKNAMRKSLNVQLQVADIVVMSKADEVDQARLKEVEEYVRQIVGDKPVIPISANNGQNLNDFVDMLVRP